MLIQTAARQLTKCPLFHHMQTDEIIHSLEDSGAHIQQYERDSFVFHQEDEPKYVLVLLSGMVVVGRTSPEGRRSVMATFTEAGELFGEVYAFLGHGFDCFATAQKKSEILEIPISYFRETTHVDELKSRMIYNLMCVFASKAYYLNQRIQSVTGATLRQKLAKAISLPTFQNADGLFAMKREDLADFVNAARPSVSRELNNMQEDGLISIEKNGIRIADPEAFFELLP